MHQWLDRPEIALPFMARSRRRWRRAHALLVVLLGLLPVLAGQRAPAAAAAPAGLGAADWQAIQDQLPLSQQAYLKASNAGLDDQFGTQVAVSGTTVVIGAPSESSSSRGVNSTPNEEALNAGAAYVFVRNGDTWTQQAYLKAANPGAGDRFGWRVAVSGMSIVVGARGEDSSTAGVNGTPNEAASNAGAAYVFVRSGATWSQQAYLKAANPGVNDWFGWSVAVSGDSAVIGAAGEDSSSRGVNTIPNEAAPESGAAYVFVRSGAQGAPAWRQQAYLKAGNAGMEDNFGWSVAVSGESVVIGAAGEDSSSSGVNAIPNEDAPEAGAAYAFVRSGTTWTQQAYLKAANPGANDGFGGSVAVRGRTIVVGAAGEDSSIGGIFPTEDALNAGAAYVFVDASGGWIQEAYLKAASPGVGDTFGKSVVVSGTSIVIGAAGEDSSSSGVNSIPNEAAENAGAAYIFMRSDGAWLQQAYLKASNTEAYDEFGSSVAMDGATMVIGAAGEDSSSRGVNSIPNEDASFAGAAYIFVLPRLYLPLLMR